MAAPFLTCDPHPVCGGDEPVDCPVEAEIFEDGQSIAKINVQADMTFLFDLAGRSHSEHTYTATFIDQYGRSSAISPNPFVLKSHPNPPESLKVVIP